MAKNRFESAFGEANESFNENYKEALEQLKGLSKKEIDSIIPKTTDSSVYSKLITVVEKAVKENTSQADLINNIKALGGVAVDIAKKIPKFTSLL